MMDPEAVGKVLAVAAIYDRRKIGTAEVRQWGADLDGLEPRLCMEAIRRHYTDPATVDTYLMPGHVIGRVRELRATQARARADAATFREIESARECYSPETFAVGLAAARQAFADAIRAKHERLGDTEEEEAAS